MGPGSRCYPCVDTFRRKGGTLLPASLRRAWEAPLRRSLRARQTPSLRHLRAGTRPMIGGGFPVDFPGVPASRGLFRTGSTFLAGPCLRWQREKTARALWKSRRCNPASRQITRAWTHPLRAVFRCPSSVVRLLLSRCQHLCRLSCRPVWLSCERRCMISSTS
jgi:hypothetical protein